LLLMLATRRRRRIINGTARARRKLAERDPREMRTVMRYLRDRPPPCCALFTYRAALAPPSAGHAAKLGLCRKTSAAEGVETGTEMRMTGVHRGIGGDERYVAGFQRE